MPMAYSLINGDFNTLFGIEKKKYENSVRKRADIGRRCVGWRRGVFDVVAAPIRRNNAVGCAVSTHGHRESEGDPDMKEERLEVG